jgi:hypothetical protein
MMSQTRRVMFQACDGVTREGSGCRARPVASSRFCFFHDPDRQAERKAAQRAGGQKKRTAVLAESIPDAPLKSAEDAVALLADTINQVRRGELDPKVANAVGYLTGLLMKGVRETEIERRLTALEAAVKPQPIVAGDEEEDWTTRPGGENGEH